MKKTIFYFLSLIIVDYNAFSQMATDSTIFKYKKAEFVGDDFNHYMTSQMQFRADFGTNGSKITKASFILTKEGTIDSLEIDSLGSSQIINNNIISALKYSKKNWTVAELAGEKISSLISVYGKVDYIERNYYGNVKNVDNKRSQTSFYYKSIPAIDVGSFYYNLGVKNAGESNYSRAIDCFSAALKLNPDDIDALFNRAIMYHKNKNDTDACNDWNKIKSIGKTDADNLIEKYCK